MATYNQHHATREYSEGNPALPRPGSDKQGRIDIDIQTRKPKKFIILCDGTGQDSSGGTAQNPTNVTRLARALAPNCWVKKEKGSNTNEQDPAEDDEYEEWEQIVSYHAGVGTFAGNNAFGVMFGDGLSEIVRSAYGFLASNWQNGDKIYIIGFSRGAYIARAIAGLVADHGLLTKRSMDNFHAVYETFYMTPARKREKEMPLKVIIADGTQRWGIAEDAGLKQVPCGTVEAVAVFDTVGFHFNFSRTDKDEGRNTLLSPNVKYAFHALSLDEDRIPFQPSLFFKPKQRMDGDGRQTILEQVWFSGAHSDVGGGMQDPRLSNIALAWMIDRLESNNLLAFNKAYLADPPPKSTVSSIAANSPHDSSSPILDETPWFTSQGPNWDVFSTDSTFIGYCFARLSDIIVRYFFWPLLEFIKFALCTITYPLNPRWSGYWTGRRTPCEYIPVKDNQKLYEEKEAYETCEYLHESIKDRLMPPKKQTNMKWLWPYSRSGHWRWPHAQKEWWPCEPLRDWKYVAGGEEGGQGERWMKKSTRGWSSSRSGGDHALEIMKHSAIEGILKAHMRFGRVLRPWYAIVPVPVPEQARPLTSEGESA